MAEKLYYGVIAVKADRDATADTSQIFIKPADSLFGYSSNFRNGQVNTEEFFSRFTEYSEFDNLDKFKKQLRDNIALKAVEKPYGPLSYPQALIALNCGCFISREGWNGKGMRVGKHIPFDGSAITEPFAYLRYQNGKTIPWICSQSDMFATDWFIVE